MSRAILKLASSLPKMPLACLGTSYLTKLVCLHTQSFHPTVRVFSLMKDLLGGKSEKHAEHWIFTCPSPSRARDGTSLSPVLSPPSDPQPADRLAEIFVR